MRLLGRLARMSLLWKIALVNLIPILLLGLVLQHYLGSRISERAVDGATKEALAISRSKVERFLSEDDLRHGLTEREIQALDATLARPENRRHVQGVTVWNRSLKVVYSPRRDEIDRRVPPTNDVRLALGGQVVSHRSGSSLAVHVPLWLETSGRPDGAVAISVDYSGTEAGVRDRTNEYSLLIFLGLVALYGLLFRIVAGASKALRQQAAVNEHQALHDALTDLPNRTLFHDRVRHALASARREHVPVAVMIMDLDRFKEVNDTLGHASGDELLKQVGLRLAGTLRESDTVARLGGDEFGVLLPKVVDAQAAVAVAGKLRRSLEEPFAVHGLALQIEASVGIALFPDHGSDVQSLLQRADVAMYIAKEHPSGYEVYTRERDDYSPDRLTLLTELRRGIDRGELVLHYQPKADLRTGEITGVEALVRWRHPERGLIGPDEFIPAAQKTGVIGPLTLFVLDEALRQCRAWLLQGLQLPVAVNLSTRNLLDLHLPETVGELLARWEVPPSLLELEITESTILADPVRAMQILSRLGEMGIRLSIDDFGTGYSSLAYLKRLPVDELKIDRSFVQGMQENDNDAVIVRSTIDLGRNLGLRVVAEGVESSLAWNGLAQLGCDTAQGHYLSRPAPAEELTEWLRDRAATRPERHLRSA
ncbi:MAG TPA: EAL domain-containing protein [Gaiellaceae bacterium]|jgi:diguanylate cyclase (GGDEF)-like protein|nr:EAL domain-containing protein [Gaiellaceae bacterium]